MRLETYLERDGKELAVVVHYTFWPGCRGARDSIGGVPNAGPPLEPDEPPSVEIERVTDKAGVELEVSDSEADELQDRCFEAHECADDD